jgi:IS5 family transposase
MGRRRIGQEEMFAAERGRAGTLDGLDAGLDWSLIDAKLAPVYAARKGEKGWPPLALFKALLLASWHALSDVRLAEALDDRASFRRFCGFSRSEPTPERTAFVRFRGELARRGLDAALFDEVARQIAAQGLMVRSGMLVDATVIAAAAGPEDTEAGWNAYDPDRLVRGYKAHVATDRSGGFVKRVHVTPANVPDGEGMVPLLGPNPGEVFADAGYDWRRLSAEIRRRRGRPRIMRRIDRRSRDAWNRRKAQWNAAIRPIRARIEKVFGTIKRSYGAARARWRGLAKTTLQVRLAFMVYNLRRATAMRSAAAA